ncbi:HIV Tat-specific factor 1 [Clonorchis sinensis]|uniref:HIV Tat-specific factor 1 n=3 Tax=Clonorchis sinensis TaxID=79923 RepID=A0A8T1N116_CLOSI|nr:HIV Tat-specific factor 1 [Clonorchis sinensis]GAA37173.1 HIV Tat-specific factor 1 [Clonorchis sinensis]
MSEDYRDFEEQLRLQSLPNDVQTSKTRVDPDGTVMEWDEKRKAWFPKIDDDFIARYQMSYGVVTTDDNQPTPHVDTENGNSVSLDWSNFNTRLAQLRAEKGENSDEVQAFTKAAHDSLTAYYNSPAYREWYENYCKHQAETAKQAPAAVTQSTVIQPRKPRHDLKPSERMRSALVDDGEDPEVALARAEAEQQAGVPLSVDTEAPKGESATEHTPAESATTESAATASTKRKTTTPAPAWYEMSEDKNTHVYVTGLPVDITESDFFELMSKYGVIMNEPFTDRPRIKLYLDEEGKPKGDGRCCYVKVESVDLAMKLLEGMEYSPGHLLHVERAKFTPKGQFDPKKRRRLTLKEKKKLKEQQESLFRWGIDTSKFVRSKKERVLVLKNAFVETDFVTDVTLIPLVRDRLRAQCAKCGVVKKIVVHDTNPLGVVTVTFNTPEEADTALGFLNKALFNYPGPGGVRQLQVERWDGRTNYSLKEDESEEMNRIHKWEEFLGGDQSSDEETPAGEHEKEALPIERGQDQPPDYWETSSPESQQDTDEAGGSSGAETS